jgi:hypothetical protein
MGRQRTPRNKGTGGIDALEKIQRLGKKALQLQELADDLLLEVMEIAASVHLSTIPERGGRNQATLMFAAERELLASQLQERRRQAAESQTTTQEWLLVMRASFGELPSGPREACSEAGPLPAGAEADEAATSRPSVSATDQASFHSIPPLATGFAQIANETRAASPSQNPGLSGPISRSGAILPPPKSSQAPPRRTPADQQRSSKIHEEPTADNTPTTRRTAAPATDEDSLKETVRVSKASLGLTQNEEDSTDSALDTYK